ncbi:hypothetical protein SDC9_133080 [bioreactor metagenome]|uniref:Secretion system C-terminal sorting domain-containing protein n=1 Tax=bioreactor metagenome TaxID=1076179 RepID=A0A645D9Y1_9ZZZZ
MELEGSGTGDKSLFAVDRFWVLRKANWTTEPVSFLTFTYRDVEFAPANTITETSLLAQYWDGAQWTPAWNSGTALFGVNNAGANQVNSISTGSGNFYTWVLADKSSFLPVELLKFEADCDASGFPVISWGTTSETNNNYFTLERSPDGVFWTTIAEIAGAGNSNSQVSYSYDDVGAFSSMNYYRLSQTDFDGTQEIEGVITSDCRNGQSSDTDSFWIECNDVNEINLSFYSTTEESVALRVFDMRGRLVFSEIVSAVKGLNSYIIPVMPEDAVYMFSITGGNINLSNKVYLH